MPYIKLVIILGEVFCTTGAVLSLLFSGLTELVVISYQNRSEERPIPLLIAFADFNYLSKPISSTRRLY